MQLVQSDAERDDDNACQYQAHADQRVRTAVKNLRHECVPASFALPDLRSRKCLRLLVLLLTALPIVPTGSAVGASAIGDAQKIISLRNSEYSSGKTIIDDVPRTLVRFLCATSDYRT